MLITSTNAATYGLNADNSTSIVHLSAAVKLLDNGQPVMVMGACVSLGEIGRNGPLPLPSESQNKSDTSKLAIVDNLVAKVKASKTHSKVCGLSLSMVWQYIATLPFYLEAQCEVTGQS